MENEIKPYCMYGKRADGTFEKREHIIPAFIGGMQKLPKGAVCDEINELFSPMEFHVSQHSILALNRMFYGPGKRGSQNRKKSGHKLICVQKMKDGKARLGYIDYGAPKLISQIELPLVRNKADGKIPVQMSLDGDYVHCQEEQKQLFLQKIREYNGHSTVIKSRQIDEERAILGWYGNKWYLGLNDREETERAKTIVESMIKRFATDKNLQEESSGNVVREQVWCELRQALKPVDYCRVMAKIAFNVAAYVNGRDRMLEDWFDGIREAIVTGEGIGEYVALSDDNNALQIFEKLKYQKLFGEQLHIVLCIRQRNDYIGYVCLYGIKQPVIVQLASNIPVGAVKHMDGFVCDWQNQKEYGYEDFLCRLIGVREEGFVR